MKMTSPKMMKLTCAVVLLGLSSVGSAFAKGPPTEKEVDAAVKTNNSNMVAARKAVPATKKVKDIEHVYDQKMIELGEAREKMDLVLGNKKATEKEIRKAEAAFEHARSQADIAGVRSIRYGDSKYRKALKDLRNSRATLNEMRDSLLADKSKAGATKRRKISSALRGTKTSNLMVSVGQSGGGREVARSGLKSFALSGATAMRGMGARPKCARPNLH